MHDEELEELHFKVKFRIKEYIEKSKLPLAFSELGDYVTVCPFCGQPAHVQTISFETPKYMWFCPSCKEEGDAVKFAMAAFGFKTKAQAVIDVCRKLGERITFLDTISAEELMGKEFPPLLELIEGMLAPGLYILAGASKIGKSWLVLQMAHHVSTGTPLWHRKTIKSDVLYLCLEDTQERIQRRLMTICDGGTGNIFFATDAEMMGMGVEEQVSSFLRGHQQIKLVIVDTLIKVRGISISRSAYADDYATMTILKNLAERFKVALVMVHHTRKQESQDIMEMISGTNGLMGCADGAIILDRPKRQLPEGSLSMTGRDFEDAKLLLRQNRETMCWEFVGYEDEQSEEERDPVLSAVSTLVAMQGSWTGTATELTEILREMDPQLDLSPNSLARKLNCAVKTLREYYGITYKHRKTANEGKLISLIPIDDMADMDGS